jgi:hypothetical protein
MAAGEELCGGTSVFFASLLFFAAGESLLDGSPACWADCWRAAALAERSNRAASEAKHAFLKIFIGMISLRLPPLIGPAKHIHVQIVEVETGGTQARQVLGRTQA